MVRWRHAHQEETEAVAADFAAELRPGDVLPYGRARLRQDDILRGACRSLGVSAPVTSPTFTIGHRYEGRVRSPTSTLPLRRGLTGRVGDLEPYFDDAVTFVEWPEAGAACCRPARFRVRMTA